MKARIVLASLVILALAFTANAQQQSGQPAPKDAGNLKDELRLREQMLARQFAEFENALLKLKDRLKRTGKTEDKQRAEVLEKVLELTKDSSISVQFEQMVEMLRNSNLSGVGDLKILDEKSRKLAEDMRAVLVQMREDPRYTVLQERRRAYEELYKELIMLIHRQKVTQGQTDRAKTELTELESIQAKITRDTDALAKKLAKLDKDEPKRVKSDSKDLPPNSTRLVEQASDFMRQAEQKIAINDAKGASGNQGDAITKLELAKNELEKLLRQMREEELEHLLAALRARCEKMLAMQLQVLSGTEGVFRAVNSLADKKPNRLHQQTSMKLSDNERDIVLEAAQAIQLLAAEGSGVAFPEVFQQIRQDMMHVQRRLEVVDVGVVTQAIESDIVDTLKEMIESLKDAQKKLEDKNMPPRNDQPPPPPPQLLNLLAELKIIRSMQMRVHIRTKTYGRMYEATEIEQTSDPTIRRELFNLSERQQRISEITGRLAKGER